MKKEIDFAVDTFHRIAFGSKKNGTKYISEAKLSRFISILSELLFARYENSWYPENPDRASAYRCIRVNSQCVDPTIVESMRRADINLPKMLGATELTIWVDPGVVSVRIGEDGSIGTEVVDEEVYNMKKAKLEKSGSVESASSSRSSSPEVGYHSDRSLSSSPVMSSQPSSRSSPLMDYNPYSPPTRVSYPNRFQPTSMPSPVNMSTPPPKSVSPIRSFPNTLAAPPTQPGAHIPVRASPISFNSAPPTADYGSQSHLNIPVNQRMMNYTRPRAIFPSTSYSSEPLVDKSITKASYSPYSMHFNNGHGMPNNFYDIPVMA